MAETTEQLTREEVSKLVTKVKDWSFTGDLNNYSKPLSRIAGQGNIGNLHIDMTLRTGWSIDWSKDKVEVSVEFMKEPWINLGKYTFDDSMTLFYKDILTNYIKEKAKRMEKLREYGLKEARELLAQ